MASSSYTIEATLCLCLLDGVALPRHRREDKTPHPTGTPTEPCAPSPRRHSPAILWKISRAPRLVSYLGHFATPSTPSASTARSRQKFGTGRYLHHYQHLAPWRGPSSVGPRGRSPDPHAPRYVIRKGRRGSSVFVSYQQRHCLEKTGRTVRPTGR